MLSFTPAITKLLQGTRNFITTRFQVYWQRKPTPRSPTHNRPNPWISYDPQIPHDYLTSGQTETSRALTMARVTNRIFNIKFFKQFVIVKNITTNWFIVLITNDRGFLTFKISRNRRDNRFIFKYTGQVNEFNPLVDKLNFDKMSNMINFWVYIWPKSMLSVTPG